MTELHSKSFLLSNTIWLGFSEVLLAGFLVVKDYQLGGLVGIEEAHMASLIIGFGVIINRILDEYSKPLHVLKKRTKARQ